LDRRAGEYVAPLAVIGLAFVWAWLDGGYTATTWYAGGLIIGGLLTVQLLGGAVSLTRSAALAACAFLAAFGVFQLLSIGWAEAKGDAWDAANRTFVYALVFLLFVGWRAAPQSRQWLVLVLGFGMAVIGVATLLSAANHVESAFQLERLSAPTGYANATAALFLIPFWAVVSLGGTPRLAIPLRALAVGTAATLAAVAYVPESRGAVYSFPVVCVILLVLARHRIRAAIALALSIAPAALFIHQLSRPFEALTTPARASATHHAAILAIACGIIAALAAAAAAIVDDRVRIDTPRRLRIASCAIVAVAVVSAVAVVAVSHPRAEASRLWSSFRSDNAVQATGATRFGTLGSNRYDFWRVALVLAKDHPVAGIGAGNFSEQYLQRRRTGEQPAYPHSLEMSLLAQTGAIGTALFLAFLGAVGLAAYRRRRKGAAEASLVAGGVTAFAYWTLHGSVDWLWEFPALGISAFLLLGLALGPSCAAPVGRRVRIGVVAACAVVTLGFVAPWIAARQVARAAGLWRQDPAAAYATLNQAADLNPLSDAAPVLAGTIAAERGDVPRMRSSFERAISRDSHNWFSHTQLAVALANEGNWTAAARSADTAARLDPREPVVQEVARAIRRRTPLRPDTVNRAVYLELQALPGTGR
jgi:O-Antigen ligase